MKIYIVVLNLFMCISIILSLLCLCILSFDVHYCVGNILQRVKTLNKMWSYKLLFFQSMFPSKYFYLNYYFELKPKMVIVVISFPCILRCSFASSFNVFILFVFFFFSMFFALLSLTKKTMILSKSHSNMTLIPDY